MRWFRHFSDAHTNEGLRKLKAGMGNEGLGIWWTVLEIIAAKMDETDRCHAAYSVQDWCSFLGIRQQKLSLFLVLTEFELGLKSSRTQDELRIECRKLLELRDEWSQRLRRESGATPAQSQSQKQKYIQTSEAIEGEPPKPSSFLPSITTEQKLPTVNNSLQKENGQFQPPEEIKLLANDLLKTAGIGDRQDKRDVAWDVYHACKDDNEQIVHTLIAEIKAGEHQQANNLVAVIRARLRQ